MRRLWTLGERAIDRLWSNLWILKTVIYKLKTIEFCNNNKLIVSIYHKSYSAHFTSNIFEYFCSINIHFWMNWIYFKPALYITIIFRRSVICLTDLSPFWCIRHQHLELVTKILCLLHLVVWSPRCYYESLRMQDAISNAYFWTKDF